MSEHTQPGMVYVVNGLVDGRLVSSSPYRRLADARRAASSRELFPAGRSRDIEIRVVYPNGTVAVVEG